MDRNEANDRMAQQLNPLVAVIDSMVPKRQPVYVSQPDDWFEVEDLIYVQGFTGEQSCKVWYDADYDGFTPFAVFRYVTLDVRGYRLKFYESDLRADELMVIEDLLRDEMECAE